MRVAITGATGLLGDSLCRVLGKAHEVLGLSHRQLEVGDFRQTLQAIRELRPDAVIHSAGIPDPDRCEADPNRAYQVNAIGTRNVAVACLESKVQMVYIGTDQVFDGTKGTDYDEFDQPNPVNVYGRSKLAGESFVREIVPRHYVIRCAWLYGGQKPNFVTNLLWRAVAGQQTELAIDHYSTPTDVDDLSTSIGAILESGQYGTYHATSQGSCSRFEMGRIILDEAGLPADMALPISLAEDKRLARRPPRTVLANLALKLCGLPLITAFDVALRRYVSSLKREELSASNT
ncbi:MAG: dTDP-4-dehydrorhamnose reductase [Bacillota bacterium]